MKKITLVIINLFLLLLSSCLQFNNSFKDYLKDYTENAAIEKIEFYNPLKTDKYGKNCVSSDSDLRIKLYLRNPRKIPLTLNLKYNLEGAFESIESSYQAKFVKLSNDENYFELLIPKDALQTIDRGDCFLREVDEESGSYIPNTTTDEVIRDISKSFITIIGNKDGTTLYYDNYNFENLAVNSAPGDIRNAVFQSDSNKQYVICFNVPQIKGTPHEYDTHNIYIGKNHWMFEKNLENITAVGTVEGTLTTEEPLGLTNLEGEASDFQKKEGCFQVYYLTKKDLAENDEEIKYLIKIEDDDGLISTANVSNKAEKLTPPVVENLTNSKIVGTDSDTGYYTVVISHDGKTLSGEKCDLPYINYEIRQNGMIYKKGVEKAPVYVNLSMNDGYSFDAYATKDYYVESDPIETITNVSVVRNGSYYVSKNGNDSWTGAKKYPFKTISGALSAISERADINDFEIYLQTDISTSLQELTDYNIQSDYLYNISNKNVKVLSSDGKLKTINGNGSEIKKGVFHITNGNFTLDNIEIQNAFTTENGAALYFESADSICTISNCKFTENGAAGFGGALCIEDCEKLFITNTSIKNNYAESLGGGVHIGTNCSKVLLGGKVEIINNFDSKQNGAKSNVCLNISTGIKLSFTDENFIGKLETGSLIGITVDQAPTVGNTLIITEGYSVNNQKHPSEIFVSDQNYGITWTEGNDEACFAVDGGTIGSQFYENYKLSLCKKDSDENNPVNPININLGAETTLKVAVWENNQSYTTGFDCNFTIKIGNQEIPETDTDVSPSVQYYKKTSNNEVKLMLPLVSNPCELTCVVTTTYKGQEMIEEFTIFIN